MNIPEYFDSSIDLKGATLCVIRQKVCALSVHLAVQIGATNEPISVLQTR